MMESFLNYLLKFNNSLLDLLFLIFSIKTISFREFYFIKPLKPCVFNSFIEATYLLLLFPLNGRRWLWSDVVRYAVNASNLADNTRRNAGQQLIRELCPVSGHSVARLNGAQDNWTSIRALITHDTNGLNVG